MTAVIKIYRQDGTLELDPLWVDLNGNKISLWDGTRGGGNKDREHLEETEEDSVGNEHEWEPCKFQWVKDKEEGGGGATQQSCSALPHRD